VTHSSWSRNASLKPFSARRKSFIVLHTPSTISHQSCILALFCDMRHGHALSSREPYHMNSNELLTSEHRRNKCKLRSKSEPRFRRASPRPARQADSKLHHLTANPVTTLVTPTASQDSFDRPMTALHTLRHGPTWAIGTKGFSSHWLFQSCNLIFSTTSMPLYPPPWRIACCMCGHCGVVVS